MAILRNTMQRTELWTTWDILVQFSHVVSSAELTLTSLISSATSLISRIILLQHICYYSCENCWQAEIPSKTNLQNNRRKNIKRKRTQEKLALVQFALPGSKPTLGVCQLLQFFALTTQIRQRKYSRQTKCKKIHRIKEENILCVNHQGNHWSGTGEKILNTKTSEDEENHSPIVQGKKKKPTKTTSPKILCHFLCLIKHQTPKTQICYNCCCLTATFCLMESFFCCKPLK